MFLMFLIIFRLCSLELGMNKMLPVMRNSVCFLNEPVRVPFLTGRKYIHLKAD